MLMKNMYTYKAALELISIKFWTLSVPLTVEGYPEKFIIYNKNLFLIVCWFIHKLQIRRNIYFVFIQIIINRNKLTHNSENAFIISFWIRIRMRNFTHIGEKACRNLLKLSP